METMQGAEVRYSRQARIESRDAELQQPQDGGIKVPANDLDLGAPHAVEGLPRVWVYGRALLVGEVAVGEAVKLSAH